MPADLPTVIYVGGYSRSGSTLLDVVLSEAFGAFGAGELTRLLEDWDTGRCSCGSPYSACPFWGDLGLDRLDERRRAVARVEGRLPRALRPFRSRDRRLHADTTRRIFAFIAERSGRTFVVDSSKSARGATHRAAALADAGLEIRYVHLLRSPFSVALSYLETGSNRAAEGLRPENRFRVTRAVLGWALANRRADRDVGNGSWPSVEIAYEDLVRDPDGVVAEIGDALELPEPRLLLPARFEEPAGHAVAGNRMRRSGPVHLERRTVPVVPGRLPRRHRLVVRGLLRLTGDGHGYTAPAGAVPTSPRRAPTRDECTVAHLCTRFGQGGSERRVIDAIRATPELRHVVITGPASDHARMARDLGGCRVWLIPALDPRAFVPWRDARALWSIRSVLRRVDPFVVHTVQSKAGLIGRLAAPTTSRRVHSVSSSGFGPGFSPVVSMIARAAERRLARRTDTFLVAGADLRDVYVDAGIAHRGSFQIVRASLDVTGLLERRDVSRLALRRARGLPTDRPLVVFAGRMEPRKGVRSLPEIFRLVLAEEATAVMVLAGTGELEAATVAASRAVSADPAAVMHLGHVEWIADLLRAADCVVLPSATEGMPQVLVQASAVGTPFVAYDVPGVGELLGLGAVGTVVPAGAVDAAAKAVVDRLRRPTEVPPPDLSSWDGETIQRIWRAILVG